VPLVAGEGTGVDKPDGLKPSSHAEDGNEGTEAADGEDGKGMFEVVGHFVCLFVFVFFTIDFSSF